MLQRSVELAAQSRPSSKHQYLLGAKRRRLQRKQPVFLIYHPVGASAAQRMGIGQPSMSEMLAALRVLFEAAPVAGTASENGRPTATRRPKRIAAALS